MTEAAFYPSEQVYVEVVQHGAHISFVYYSKGGLSYQEYVENEDLEFIER